MNEIVVVPPEVVGPEDPMQALALAQTQALNFLHKTKADKKEVDELRVANRLLEEQCSQLHAQMHQVHHLTHYWTVVALLTALNEERDLEERKAMGRELKAIGQELGIALEKRPDDRWKNGSVNTYHPFVCREYCRRNKIPAPPAIKHAKDPR